MEQDGGPLSARPALESEGLRFLHVTMGSLLATYGWYVVLCCALLYAVFQKLSTRLRASRGSQLDAAAAEPDAVVKRQEALAAARLKMQEELNAQVERHKEKLRQVTFGWWRSLFLETWTQKPISWMSRPPWHH